MHRNFTKMIFGLVLTLFCLSASAQTTITGSITDESGEGLLGVNVLVDGTVLGTITDINGDYSLTVQSAPPFTLVVSYVGFESQRIEVSSSTTTINVELAESTLLGQEVVVSASRVEENVLKSPVSIERMDILDIQNAATPDFYASLQNLNGVDFSTQSLTFNSVNMRGFGSNGNVRFVQLIDGIDNQAPGLNFPAGNVVGIGELDLESVELLPGAASALYGPNAIQGILLMRSKSPFDYQGLDFYSKLGATHVDEEDHPMALYRDQGFRYAKAFNNKFAFKINASWLNAQDFIGVDFRDQSGATIEQNAGITNRANNRIYDGVNSYGEFLVSVGAVADGAIAAGGDAAAAIGPIRSLIPDGANGLFTPTGFNEGDFVDNTTESLKLGAAMHYRLNDKVEALVQFNYGTGSTVYTANDRFVLDGLRIWTGKAELRGDNFYLRGYTTQENSGDTYAANTLAQLVNFEYYIGDYLTGYAGAIGAGVDPLNYDALHAAGRQYADDARANGVGERGPYLPGTPLFEERSDFYRSLSIADGGAKFLDRSALWHYEGGYNFKNEIDFAEVIAGAHYRVYDLESEGTLFTLDENGDEISYYEYGAYVQIAKDILDNFKLQGSMRFDKSEFFDAAFTPRISGVWEFLNNSNLRASYQRGIRFPQTQDQFIDLDVVSRRLLGRNQILLDNYNIEQNTVYTTASLATAQETGNIADLEVADVYGDWEPEIVNTIEAGYKGLLLNGKLLVDVFGFYSTYTNFNAEVEVVQAVVAGESTGSAALPAAYTVSTPGQRHEDAQLQSFVAGAADGISFNRYSFDTNVRDDIETYGGGISAEYTFLDGYSLGGNASTNRIRGLDPIEQRVNNAAFNTPEWRYNITFGNRKLTEKLGFGLTYRWQDAYLWQSAFGSGIVPAFSTLDAQVTYRIPSINARVKVGGSNILNERYTTSLANPRLGALYYVQINLDNILSNF